MIMLAQNTKARNTDLGLQAVAELEKQGFRVNFHQLDIDNSQSIQTFAKYLKEKHDGLDLLVNNAAIAYKVHIIFSSMHSFESKLDRFFVPRQQTPHRSKIKRPKPFESISRPL